MKKIRDLVLYLLYMGCHGLYRIGVLEHPVEWPAAKKRQRIRPEISVEDFFRALQEREVDYVVLRWHHELPQVRKGKDIDILLADEDLEKIIDLTTTWPVGQRCDIYTTTGVENFDHKGTPLFPPDRAQQILAGAQWYRELIRVPATADQLFALAYHATYIKGPASGLATELPVAVAVSASHDYARTLTDLGEQTGVQVPRPVTMESLDSFLSQHGWRPPEEMLERFAAKNDWLACQLDNHSDLRPEVAEGLAVFFIRRRAVKEGLEASLIDLIEAKGFEILYTETLDGERQRAIADEIRGGNWGRGPWPVSGGEPAVVIVGFDIMPSALTARERRQYPLCENRRLLLTKAAARNRIQGQFAPPLRFNPLHSTDSAAQAWRFVSKFMPDTREAICATVGDRRAEFATTEPVVRPLSNHGTRAKVELVAVDGREVVKKTYRKGARRFLDREVSFLTSFADRPEVPELLGRGENCLLLRYYENTWRPRTRHGIPRLLPLAAVRQLAEFFKVAAAAGYDLIDVSPRQNVLLDRRDRLKVVDFEFAYRHPAAVRPEKCYAIVGLPPDFDGDYPPAVKYIKSPYGTEWFPYTGLSADCLFYGSRPVQMLQRAINYPLFLLRWGCAKVFSRRRLYRLAKRTYRRMKNRTVTTPGGVTPARPNQ